MMVVVLLLAIQESGTRHSVSSTDQVRQSSYLLGGVALNKGGVIFATGTADKFAYALDSENGEILWTYEMEAAGSAPPILFNIDGKQYVSFVSTGRKALTYNAKEKASKIYTFSVE